MAHEDRWRLEFPDNGFEMRHDRGNFETFDGRRIAVECFDLDLEPRICRSKHVVAAGLIACDPMLPASERHPEAMNQYNRVGTFRWCGHGMPPLCIGPRPGFLDVKCNRGAEDCKDVTR